ncbi:hypothetical protein AYO47_07250 [Planctomyces sp. SCGC AG-212-M04]|nr:hypothetical protein AYO47_07250 [Planctomyces sp. SCGC AG-212-M04]
MPRWAVMWALAFAIYAGLKLLSWLGRPGGGAPMWKHVAYLFAWPGMDANAFLFTPAVEVVRPRWREWVAAWVKFGAGIVIVAVAIRSMASVDRYLVGWAGMIGIVLALHFGLFHLLSCLWRRLGVQATPIMHSPLAAATVSDFWSRRWNMAFRDLTSRFVIRPLRRPLGAGGAIAAGFLISGVIHDIVISLPAGAGFGGPTVYFALQGAAVFLERSPVGRSVGLGRGLIGRVFAWTTVLGLAPLLLHRPFVECVVVPFLAALGELS